MATPFLIFQASCLAQLAWACKPGNCHDESSVLQRQSRRTMTCPHGEEEYTFADWAPKLYTTDDVPANGITITGFTVDDGTNCKQPAILSDANSGGGGRDILACNCNALIMASDDSTDALAAPCSASNAVDPRFDYRPTIEMTFDEPQDIVEVTFYNVKGAGSLKSEFIYTTTAGDTVTVDMPEQGRFNPSVVDLTQEEIKPESVTKIEVKFQGRVGFTGMKLCKGGGSLVGDPHVRTQDHAHYTVLNEGNFLAWRFNSDTAVDEKSRQVDWRIYAHYSAHRRSWTRGLLLVDQSMGSRHHSLEFTSEECKLRQRVGDEWRVMESSEMLQASEGGHFVTGINLTHLENGTIHFDSKKILTPKGKKARWDAEFLMATSRGKQRIASVQLRCFPGRHIDIQVVRERMGDARFVEGQLGHHGIQLKREKNGLGHWFHTSSDREFQLSKSWRELGGSREAAAFFDIEDKNAKAVMLGNPTCTPEEKQEAMRLCEETMKMSRNVDAEFLDECVLDICAGGGAAAAELAGDIFSA